MQKGFQAAFEIEKLTVAVRGKTLLNIESLMLPMNANTAIIGANGAGKSTLLKALIRQIGTGTVRLFGQAVEPQLKQGKIAWVGQHGRYSMPLTVHEYIGLAYHTVSGCLKKNPEQENQLLAYFDLSELADKRIEQLSGGEQQRANIVRALLQNAPTLLLDEPCNHLDIRHQHQLMQFLQQQKQHHANIMVLHDLNLAARYADYIVLAEQGRIVAAGTPSEVMQEPILAQVYRCPIRKISDGDNGYFCV